MKLIYKYILAAVGAVVLNSCYLNKFERSVGCSYLEQSDSLKLEVSGLMDHNDLSIEWVVEEVKSDSIKFWYKKYETQFYSNLSGGLPVDTSRIFSVTERWMESSWAKVSPYIKKSDRIFYFTTPDLYWSSLSGQDGLIVIRNCKVIVKIILTQS